MYLGYGIPRVCITGTSPAGSIVIHGGSTPYVGTLWSMFGGKVGDLDLETSLGYV